MLCLILLLLSWLLFVDASANALDEIRIGVTNTPPFSVITQDANNSTVLDATGVYINMYNWITTHANLKYKLIALNDSETARIGAYTASLAQMFNDEVDIAAFVYVASAERLSLIDFSFPVNAMQYRFMTPLPGQESRVWAIIKPFQPAVWLVLLITLIVFVFILSLLSSVIEGRKVTWVNTSNLIELLGRNLTFAIATLTNQAGSSVSVASNRDSFRILAGAWFLIALILVNSYAGLLKPSLTVQRMKPVIDSFEDLVSGKKQEGLTLAVNVDSYIGRSILKAESGLLRKMGDQLRSRPDGQFTSMYAGRNLLLSLRYAVLDPIAVTHYSMGLDYKLTNGTCRYWESHPVPFITYSTLALKKYGQHNSAINKALYRLMEVGLYGHWLKEEHDKVSYDKCKANNIIKPTTQEKLPIKLSDLASAFIVLVIGILVSVFIFMIELAASPSLVTNVLTVNLLVEYSLRFEYCD